MDFFFDPKGVAVVGATPDPNAGGHHLLANLTLGYQGPIYPVNPKYDKILGLKCYSRVSEIDGPLDLVLIFVPARAVPQVLEDCVAKGARGAIIQSGGFAEVGPDGKAIQDRCLAIARGGSLASLGAQLHGVYRHVEAPRLFLYHHRGVERRLPAGRGLSHRTERPSVRGLHHCAHEQPYRWIGEGVFHWQ